MVCKSKLKALIEKELAGAKVRSRAKWIEQGNKPTSFFLLLERNRDHKHLVTSILDQNGKEVSTQTEIEEAHVHFYTDLYSESEIDNNAKTSL